MIMGSSPAKKYTPKLAMLYCGSKTMINIINQTIKILGIPIINHPFKGMVSTTYGDLGAMTVMSYDIVLPCFTHITPFSDTFFVANFHQLPQPRLPCCEAPEAPEPSSSAQAACAAANSRSSSGNSCCSRASCRGRGSPR